jgi:hypothetical protein
VRLHTHKTHERGIDLPQPLLFSLVFASNGAENIQYLGCLGKMSLARIRNYAKRRELSCYLIDRHDFLDEV